MLVKTVVTTVENDSAGRPMDVIAVRAAVASDKDAAGNMGDIMSVTEDPSGIPVRVVATKYATDSAGRLQDAIPVAYTA